MVKKFNIKETDAQIVLRVNTDLSGSTARVLIRPLGGTTLPDLPAVITNPSLGEITVETDSVAIGQYDLEIEQDQGGKLFHYPNKGYDRLIVEPDLDA